MSICLCDISALEVIRSSGKLVGELLESPRCSSLEDCRAPSALELEDLVAGLGVRTRPIHVLTREGLSTQARVGVVRHRCASALTRSSLISIKKDLLVASPELVVAQLAARDDYDIVDLAQVAVELCGTYLLDPDENSWSGFTNIDEPCSSRSRIEGVLNASTSMRGAPKLRRALSGITDGSHSPMETVLALLLGLPRSVGGLGLSGFTMNYRVTVGSSFYLIDLAFPKLKVGLEYKGRAYHTIEQSGRDDRRQNELVGMGWTILNVWSEDLKSPALFSKLLDSLFRALGRRSRPGEDYLRRQDVLRRRLVPGSRS